MRASENINDAKTSSLYTTRPNENLKWFPGKGYRRHKDHNHRHRDLLQKVSVSFTFGLVLSSQKWSARIFRPSDKRFTMEIPRLAQQSAESLSKSMARENKQKIDKTRGPRKLFAWWVSLFAAATAVRPSCSNTINHVPFYFFFIVVVVVRSLKLSLIDYQKFLEELAKAKKVDIAEIREKMIHCGPPIAAAAKTNVKQKIVFEILIRCWRVSVYFKDGSKNGGRGPADGQHQIHGQPCKTQNLPNNRKNTK